MLRSRTTPKVDLHGTNLTYYLLPTTYYPNSLLIYNAYYPPRGAFQPSLACERGAPFIPDCGSRPILSPNLRWNATAPQRAAVFPVLWRCARFCSVFAQTLSGSGAKRWAARRPNCSHTVRVGSCWPTRTVFGCFLLPGRLRPHAHPHSSQLFGSTRSAPRRPGLQIC